MQRNKLALIVTTFVGVCLFIYFNQGVGAIDTSSQFIPVDFSIIHSSNIRGETEPCGWPKNPLGGLARKASIIDNENADSLDVLFFDTGDLFFITSLSINW